MHVYRVKDYKKSRNNQWGALLFGVLLAMMMVFSPATAQAATDGWWPHFMRGSAFPGFWLTGEIVTVEEGSVTLQLPNHHRHHGRGMMRYVSLQVMLDVDSNSVLLDEELATLDLTTLAEGDEVVVVPGLVWGNLVARLLYAGEPEELADAAYRGVLVAEEGNTLTLKNGRMGEFTVQVDETTVWYDNGPMARPTELAEEMTLRVLGIAGEDEAGDETIHAVLITPGR
jgi:hypothetical protein